MSYRAPAFGTRRQGAFRSARLARAGGLAGAARSHFGIVVLLLVAAALRIISMLAYRPALFFSDSWGYLFTAFTGHPVSLSYLRPNGYSVLLRILTLPGRNLDQVVVLQHLSGLLTGALVYVALTRCAAPRLLAVLAAALILLDGYRTTLEQYLMPDTFFTLTLLLSALVIAWPGLRDTPASAIQATGGRLPARAGRAAGVRRAAVAGLLLGVSVLQREAAMFAVPAFLVYAVACRLRPRAVIAFLLALAIPVVGYATVYDARIGVFGLSESGGWTLYGRVAGFANCTGAGIPRSERPLCETASQRRSHSDAPGFYIWHSNSPAARLFHGGHQTREVQERANRVLGNFAHRIILHEPLRYLGASLADTLRYFTPGATQYSDAESATSLPADAAAEPSSERVRRRVIPNVHPAVRSPASLARWLRDNIHLPRALLAILAIASLLVPPFRRRYRWEVALFSGAGLLMILGTAATAGFGLRYLLPTVPLFAIGGSLALLVTPRRAGAPGASSAG